MPSKLNNVEKGSSLTASCLKNIIHYDPIIGEFTWLVRASRMVPKGMRAGKTDRHGYRRIKIGGTTYKAHRLAWLYQYGEWPNGPIDHIDGNPSNNAIVNLRIGSNGINQQNVRRKQKNNTSGFMGVHKRSDSNRYRACVSLGGKNLFFGSFETPEEAHAVYLEKKRKLHAGCTI
ncbi:MAG: hypothetical protein DI635_00715 [Pseudoxanthomonas suwonensis]|nr:MAG: hypothetical protein DI635_00715 [Pseudoxanthomonas suwonensis]